jgi:hypothetical protein
MANKIQLRRDTAANWTTANPVLAQGEPGVELDTNKWKIGNGTSTWTALSYQGTQLPANSAGYLYNNGSGTLSWGTIQAGGTVTSVGLNTGTTGLTVTTGPGTYNPITATGVFTLAGKLDIPSGGTNATDAATARTNLSAAKSGSNGDITELTGLTTALSIPQGGTGAITAEAALNNLLPPQAANPNKVLATNGTTVSWENPSVYTLPIASNSVLGGIKVGSGLQILGDGTLYVVGGGGGGGGITSVTATTDSGITASTVGGAVTLNTTYASQTIPGVVKVDNLTIAISSEGVISAQQSIRQAVQSSVSVNNNTRGLIDITGQENYALLKIQTSAASWVTLYVSDAARTADASRSQGVDPGPNSGVIAEIITAGPDTVVISPAVIGFNNETIPTNIIPVAVTNLSGATATITVTLTILKL